MINIGPYQLDGQAVLAPMAGITDRPFRQVCRHMGAAMVTAEMSTSKADLRQTSKSLLRLADAADSEPRVIQIVGTDPVEMAIAARYHVDAGAQIVDINMGCPAKKVCKKLAGSALMKNPSLVADILKQVVDSVDVPVTLKIRTGWNLEQRNAVQIAQMAEDLGIQSLAVHGRSRACRFNGMAEYDTIAEVVAGVNIPVFANGDIDSGQNAQKVLNYTAASGVMIGRAAQGRPWIFAEINQYLNPSSKKRVKSDTKTPWHFTTGQKNLVLEHLELIHRYYGRFETENLLYKSIKQSIINKDQAVDLAVRISRKHVCWYFNQMVQCISNLMNEHTSDFPVPTSSSLVAGNQAIRTIEIAKKQFNTLLLAKDQLQFLKQFFSETNLIGDIAA
ncbi:MAG: tRNA dihydrouridine synthase DusB [Pseudomonadales bacterium]|nr:tRNA dihydrouridine synthase DusB [Pseudomonadales bacterium]